MKNIMKLKTGVILNALIITGMIAAPQLQANWFTKQYESVNMKFDHWGTNLTSWYNENEKAVLAIGIGVSSITALIIILEVYRKFREAKNNASDESSDESSNGNIVEIDQQNLTGNDPNNQELVNNDMILIETKDKIGIVNIDDSIVLDQKEIKIPRGKLKGLDLLTSFKKLIQTTNVTIVDNGKVLVQHNDDLLEIAPGNIFSCDNCYYFFKSPGVPLLLFDTTKATENRNEIQKLKDQLLSGDLEAIEENKESIIGVWTRTQLIPQAESLPYSEMQKLIWYPKKLMGRNITDFLKPVEESSVEKTKIEHVYLENDQYHYLVSENRMVVYHPCDNEQEINPLLDVFKREYTVRSVNQGTHKAITRIYGYWQEEQREVIFLDAKGCLVMQNNNDLKVTLNGIMLVPNQDYAFFNKENVVIRMWVDDNGQLWFFNHYEGTPVSGRLPKDFFKDSILGKNLEISSDQNFTYYDFFPKEKSMFIKTKNYLTRWLLIPS